MTAGHTDGWGISQKNACWGLLNCTPQLLLLKAAHVLGEEHVPNAREVQLVASLLEQHDVHWQPHCARGGAQPGTPRSGETNGRGAGRVTQDGARVGGRQIGSGPRWPLAARPHTPRAVPNGSGAAESVNARRGCGRPRRPPPPRDTSCVGQPASVRVAVGTMALLSRHTRHPLN